MRVVARAIAGILFAGGGALATAGPAAGHTDFLGANPHDGASLQQLPDAVRLEFSDDMDPSLSAVTLREGDGAGTSLELVNGDTAAVLVAPVPASVTPGNGTTRWTVTFRVVSRDGHPVVGSTEFVVRNSEPAGQVPRTGTTTDPGSPESTPEPPPDLDPVAADGSERGTNDNSAAWLIAIGVGVLVLLGLAVATVMRFVGRDEDS